MADKKVTEQYYTPPPKLGGWESFKLFLWNGETNQFMGRTAASWGKCFCLNQKTKIEKIRNIKNHIRNGIEKKLMQISNVVLRCVCCCVSVWISNVT